MLELGLFVTALCLPIAAWSGYRVGVKQVSSDTKADNTPWRTYLRSLRQLLDEQPDETTFDSLLEALKKTPDSFETALALGSLFRRRGELDKAIHTHQALLAQPDLSSTQREQTLHALGDDYLQAGVYDRAEDCLITLAKQSNHAPEIMAKLLGIFERQKDWAKALEWGAYAPSWQENRQRLAHYQCELAIQAKLQGNPHLAHRRLQAALARAPRCARVSLLQGEYYLAENLPEQALSALKRVAYQEPRHLPTALPLLKSAYQALDDVEGLKQYLHRCLVEYPYWSLIVAYAECVLASEGHGAASLFLSKYLKIKPNPVGWIHWIETRLPFASGHMAEELTLLRELLHFWQSQQPAYLCEQCGFSSTQLHWQCPSCRSWHTSYPNEVQAKSTLSSQTTLQPASLMAE